MKRWLPLILLALLLAAAVSPACAATKSVPIGEEALEVFPGRPLNVVNLYRVNQLFLPSYADAQQVSEYAASHKLDVKLYQSSGLPTLYLQTASGSEKKIHDSKKNEETGAMLLVDAEGNTLHMGALSQIRIRGNSTTMYSKKAYQIKLDAKADLLGMGKAKTWVLLANVIDGTLLRNTLALNLARAAGLPFTSQCRAVDVYLNGEYKGNYLLCEKVQIGKERIAINDLEEETELLNGQDLSTYGLVYGTASQVGTPEESVTVTSRVKSLSKLPDWLKMKPGVWSARDIPLDPEDISGGYLLEVALKNNISTPARFTCDSGWKLVIKEPENASQAQVLYIFGIFQRIDTAITQGDWDTLSGLIDVDSWVGKYVYEELLANFDAGASSQYFYKASGDDKIYCGPVWDYDNILGISSKMKNPEVLYLQDTPTAHVHYPYDLFLRVTQLEPFMAQARAMYRDVYRPLALSLLGEGEADTGLHSIAEEAAAISASRDMNFLRWRHYHESRLTEIGDSEEEGLAYLTDFLRRRIAFLDSIWLTE